MQSNIWKFNVDEKKIFHMDFTKSVGEYLVFKFYFIQGKQIVIKQVINTNIIWTDTLKKHEQKLSKQVQINKKNASPQHCCTQKNKNSKWINILLTTFLTFLLKVQNVVIIQIQKAPK